MEDRRLLSRYGVWLIVGLCTPTEETPIPLLGRLLGALCHWFSATQYLPDDQQGATIERLKSDYLHSWLQEIVKNHFDVFVSCLLPHPVEYAKVGGHWDTLASKSDHVKEGFRRLFCLVPYDLVTQQVWEKVMPHWMEAIHNEVPEKDLVDLKITLSKLLDPEMSPLGFDSMQMYSFIAARFINTDETIQEQTLSWLQLLSSLSITIPIYQLLEMFQDGVKALLRKHVIVKKDDKGDLPTVEAVEENYSDGETNEPGDDGKKPYDNTLENQTPPEQTLTCFILMFDVFYKQLDVQEIEKHKGVVGPVSIPFLTLMKEMLRSPCLAPHTCSGDKYCTTCDLTITYFQLTMDILAYLLPLLAIQNNRVADMIPPEPDSSQMSKEDSSKDSVTEKMPEKKITDPSAGKDPKTDNIQVSVSMPQ
ncbi:Protein unc-79-like protein, partial [Armadillidium nasatum]